MKFFLQPIYCLLAEAETATQLRIVLIYVVQTSFMHHYRHWKIQRFNTVLCIPMSADQSIRRQFCFSLALQPQGLKMRFDCGGLHALSPLRNTLSNSLEHVTCGV